jgi:NAD+ kinase
MTRRRLLVVYKKSQLDLYREHEPSSIEFLRRREPNLLERFELAHQENKVAIDLIRQAIGKRDVDARFAYRAEHESGREYDLVISVGGDGTLLDVSHTVKKTPLMGVNSSPGSSVGHFCAVDAVGFGDALDQWLDDTLHTALLNRLQVTVNGQVHPTPVLNEMLYAHTVPGAVSRYVIRCGDIEEEHKSSGIWISTAAGSTAAIRSAGGQVMKASDNRLQFIVREPYQWFDHSLQLLHGFSEEPIKLLGKMRSAALYLDGHRRQIEMTVGDRVIVGSHPYPLKLVGYKSNVS